MSKEETLQQVVQIASKLFKHQMEPADSQDTVGSWTSRGHLELILELELHLKLKLPPAILAKLNGFSGVDSEGHPTGWSRMYTLSLQEIADIIFRYSNGS